MITLELAKTKLNELNVLVRYLPFLQNNGFSDIGRGKILGQVQLLKELINEGGNHLEYDKETPQEMSLASKHEEEANIDNNNNLAHTLIGDEVEKYLRV
ncbi:MAG TPA: hypothetical protein VE130_09205 [Nitrososphaeraceae archaeon]|jgi:hypothetical protein|nr:hypothetical protein [Nitrososphaeraceae archaeon]